MFETLMKLNEDVKINPPWRECHLMVTSIFGKDSDVFIRELYAAEGGHGFIMQIPNEEKAVAIRTLLPRVINFGNSSLTIIIIGRHETASEIKPLDTVADPEKLIKDAFTGNKRLSRVLSRDMGGFVNVACVFKPEVVQFYNDDLSDIFGNYNALAQDIMKCLLDKDLIAKLPQRTQLVFSTEMVS